jgi:hypothetical protein
MQTGEQFNIELTDITMQVTSHIVNNDEVFRIEFSDGRPPMVVFESLSGGRPFWTSIPQGRQREAEFFGARIAEHFKTK